MNLVDPILDDTKRGLIVLERDASVLRCREGHDESRHDPRVSLALLSSVRDAETGQRGYLMAGSED